MPPLWNLLLTAAWIAAGMTALWTMLRLFGGDTAAEGRDRITSIHRWSGRIFVALYAVLLASMAVRSREAGEITPIVAAHIVLGLSLAPLLAVKIAIARRWKPLHKLLPALGLVVGVLAFVTAALGGVIRWTAGSGGDSTIESLEGAPGDPAGRQAFLTYCGQCHSHARPLDRARAGGVTAAGWKATIGKMERTAARRGARLWTAAEGESIAQFLAAQAGAAAPAPGTAPGGADAADDRGRRRGGRGADD